MSYLETMRQAAKANQVYEDNQTYLTSLADSKLVEIYRYVAGLYSLAQYRMELERLAGFQDDCRQIEHELFRRMRAPQEANKLKVMR